MSPGSHHPLKRQFADRWRQMVALVRHLGQSELPLLLSGLFLFAASYIFIELAGNVIEGETQQIDEAILLAMRNPEDRSDPIGPAWLEETMRDYTALGGTGILTLVFAVSLIYLVLRRNFEAAILVAAAIAGGTLLSFLLKQGFDRPRPDLVPHGSYVTMASFPSGHSMLSAVTYLTLGVLLAQVHSRRRMKVFFLLVAMLVTLLVGISRVYLGVHWPSDVLGGWSVGAAWATLCWSLALWLQRRGHVEAESSEDEP